MKTVFLVLKFAGGKECFIRSDKVVAFADFGPGAEVWVEGQTSPFRVDNPLTDILAQLRTAAEIQEASR